MTRPKVSVIVPVYNVAPYIEKCARSLFEQTLEDLEILFVDDCSPDNSIDIIKNVLSEYPEKRLLTRIIKMPTNGGQAAVRRQGIIEATGEFIIHCDGDDWVDPTLYETLYNLAKQENADIAVCDEVMEYDGYTVPKPTCKLPDNGKEIMRNWYKQTVGMFCHNKLVKRSIYKDNDILPWVGLNMWEDNGLFARLFYHAEKVVQIQGGPMYHYNRANINAMTSRYGIKQVEQMIGIAEHLSDFFRSKADASEFEKTVNAFKYLAKLNLITDSFKNYRRYRELFQESDSIEKELDKLAFSSKGRLRFEMVHYGLTPIFILLFKGLNVVNSLKANLRRK